MKKGLTMNFILHINATDNTPVEISYSTVSRFPMSFNVLGIEFTLTQSSEYSLTEYSLSFIPSEEICLNSISLVLPFEQNSLGGELPLVMFDNKMSTNAFAQIVQLSENNGDIRSREIVTVHSKRGDLNAAFTTFERFYTEFVTNGKYVKAVWHLENKRIFPGKEYLLEKLALDDSLDALEFFERYTQTLHDRYAIKDMKVVPAGWSSWSCLYNNVDEQAVLSGAVVDVLGLGC